MILKIRLYSVEADFFMALPLDTYLTYNTKLRLIDGAFFFPTK